VEYRSKVGLRAPRGAPEVVHRLYACGDTLHQQCVTGIDRTVESERSVALPGFARATGQVEAINRGTTAEYDRILPSELADQ